MHKISITLQIHNEKQRKINFFIAFTTHSCNKKSRCLPSRLSYIYSNRIIFINKFHEQRMDISNEKPDNKRARSAQQEEDEQEIQAGPYKAR